jgi:hypothetical protein
MKLVSAFLVVTVGFSAQAIPPKRNQSQHPTFPMKTGKGEHANTLATMSEDEIARMIGNLTPRQIDQIVKRAAEAEVAKIQRLLPQWCSQIPGRILFYVGFDANDTLSKRAYRFMRLALLVRDMYEDLPINHVTFDTYNAEEELPTPARYQLVARSFLNAYALLDEERVRFRLTDDDTLSSLVDMGRWALYYNSLAGQEDVDTFVPAATAMNELATTLLGRRQSPGLERRAAQLGWASHNAVTGQLAGLLASALRAPGAPKVTKAH